MKSDLENNLEEMKEAIRGISKTYNDPFMRARRVYIKQRAVALSGARDVEYEIKGQISKQFAIPYKAVCIAGSAQLGFSVNKDRVFDPAHSDLDVACVDVSLFERAWTDVVTTTRAFTNETKFTGLSGESVIEFKNSILRRGMIRVEWMPHSDVSNKWKNFQQSLTRRYTQYFSKITCAIYINEYAFCWKQSSALEQLIGIR